MAAVSRQAAGAAALHQAQPLEGQLSSWTGNRPGMALARHLQGHIILVPPEVHPAVMLCVQAALRQTK